MENANETLYNNKWNFPTNLSSKEIDKNIKHITTQINAKNDFLANNKIRNYKKIIGIKPPNTPASFDSDLLIENIPILPKQPIITEIDDDDNNNDNYDDNINIVINNNSDEEDNDSDDNVKIDIEDNDNVKINVTDDNTNGNDNKPFNQNININLAPQVKALEAPIAQNEEMPGQGGIIDHVGLNIDKDRINENDNNNNKLRMNGHQDINRMD
ncbi:hypothetical protein N8459_02945, partial [Nitrosopumilus sp.]|nr:hypothetical protein [Nitrosopumilus sp.]